MEYKIEGLSQQEVNVICTGLGELPLKFGYDLVNKINDQVMQQNSKPPEVNESYDNS